LHSSVSYAADSIVIAYSKYSTSVLGTSIYAAYLGLQWRRLREIGEEIKVLNKELPKLSSGPPKIPFSDAKAFITRELISLAADDASASVLQKDLALLDGAGDLDLKVVHTIDV
jgi:hypothetical protein